MSAIIDSIASIKGKDFFIPETFINPPWDERGDYSAILTCLHQGELIYSYPMREFLERHHKTARFNNEVHYGILLHRGSHIAIVYKPKEGDEISAAYAEMVAYETYERTIAPYTGNHLIPPTVVRTMPDRRMASCQFFVETHDMEDMWDPIFRKEIFRDSPPELIEEMAVFNSVFNNWDRHPGNYLATRNKGRVHLTSIDNESIENKGWLQKWGERSYIPVAFTDNHAAQIEKILELQKTTTLEDFKTLLLKYGFKDERRIDFHFNNLMDRGAENDRACLIKNGCFAIRFHHGNPSAFPLPKGPYSQSLIDAYRHLNREILEECFRPLVALDPRFGTRIDDILIRRDLFLEAVCSEKLNSKIGFQPIQ